MTDEPNPAHPDSHLAPADAAPPEPHRPTLMTVHAHPDDETIGTGGVMAKAVAAGRRVVLVTGTRGEQGEIVVPAIDTPDNHRRLGELRAAELEAAMGELGVTEWENLGYRDSDMMGRPGNNDPRTFWQADVDEAAERLATILREESADVLTIYDWHGNYGHPDHIKVHQVGCRAEEMVAADLPGLRVFEATMNRDEIKRQMAMAREAGEEFGPDGDFDPEGPMDDGNPMGITEDELTLVVDVSDFVRNKHAAITAHASQVTDSGFFSQMTPEMFALAFGREWFIEHGRQPGLQPGWLFEEV